MLRLLRNAPLAAWIATATFLLAALSNNTLSAKQPIVTIVFVLLLALSARGSESMRER
jgi:ABC-type amino acid transport system permease subunit